MTHKKWMYPCTGFLYAHTVYVVEQVQLLQWKQPVLITSPRVRNRDRGQGRSNETTTVDPARKVGGALDEKKTSKIHVWKWWRSLVRPCVREWAPCAISGRCHFSVEAHAKFRIRLQAAEPRKYARLCRHAPTHEHTRTLPRRAPWYSCLLSWLVLGKGLSGRSEVAAVGFQG